MWNRPRLRHRASLGKTKCRPVAGITGLLPDFLLLGIQQAVHIKRLARIEHRWMGTFHQMHLEAAILFKLKIETTRPLLVCLHLPAIDVRHDPHQHLRLLAVVGFGLLIGGNKINQPHFVTLPQILKWWRDNQIAGRSIRCGSFFCRHHPTCQGDRQTQHDEKAKHGNT